MERTCSGRAFFLKEIGPKGLKELKTKSVFVVGCGGLGSFVLTYLSRLGLKKLIIVDFDKVELHNLDRQILFDIKDINKEKTEITKQKTSQFTKTTAFSTKIENIDKNKEMLKEFKEADIILDCLDAYCSKQFLFNLCLQHNKTLVYATVLGTKGYTMIINKKNQDKAKMLIMKKPEKTEENGVYSLSVAQVASIQTNLCIKHLLGKKQESKLYISNAWNNEVKQLRL